VYVHKKKTNGEIFYVGKGSGQRAWSGFGRNALWKRTADKYGWYVEIVESNLQDWYAFELEMNLISLYGRRDLWDGPLTNLSDGGDGPSRLNPATRRKISEALSGLNCHTADRNNYSFYNFVTKMKFFGTRVGFEKEFGVMVNGLFSKKNKGMSSRFGWVVLDHLPEGTDPEKIEGRTMEGMNNSNADLNEYTFLQLSTGDTFKGTRVEARNSLKINTNTLFFSDTTSKGWVVLDGKTKEDLVRLSDPHKAGTEKRKDKTIYNFSNKDGSKFTGTREEFAIVYGFSPYHLLSNNPAKSQRGWYLSEKEADLNKSKRCQKLYNWTHPIFGDFSCTREQLERMYSLDTRPLFLTNKPNNTCKGWSLSPQQPE